jgi:hypothetical protein
MALLGAAAGAAVFLVPPPVFGLVLTGVLVALALLIPAIGLGGLLVTGPVYLILAPAIPRGLPFSFLLLVLTLVGLMVRRVHEVRRPAFRWHWADAAAAVLLVNGLLYIPMAGTMKSGIYGFHENLRLFLIYGLVRLLNPGPDTRRFLLVATGLVLFSVTAYGIVQSFVGYEWVMHRYGLTESLRDYAGFQKAGVRRAYSVIGSPLSLGIMGMITAFGGLAILLGSRRRDGAWLAAPFLVAAGAGASALSYTRSSWIGIGAGLATAVLVLARGRARWFLLAAPFAIGWVAWRLIPDLAERIGRYALTIASQDPAETSFHYIALVEAARFFWQNKLGVGLGEASFAGYAHGTGVQMWSENTFFLVGIQMGFQAMLALLVFLAAVALTGGRLATRAVDPGDRRLGAMLVLSMAGFTVAGIAHPALLDVASMAPVWVLAAIAVNRVEAGALRGKAGPET